MIDRQLRQQLCNGIDTQRIIDDLQAMIAIPSMNPFRQAPRKDYRERELAEYYADRMSDLGLDVAGIELSPTAVRICRKAFEESNLPGEFTCGDVRALPYGAASFDA